MDDVIHRFFSDLNLVVVESTSELSILFLILLLFVMIILIGFYVYNRTAKLNKLDRQIPASLVRSYLNSIIRNSSELKDSLFIDEGQVSTSDVQNDIMALREELKEKEKIINQLSQQKLGGSSPNAPILMEGGASSEELEKITKERNDLLVRISDYQKAEEDFANLKKLKQENEDLKKRLGLDSNKKTEENVVVKGESAPIEINQVLQFDQTSPKFEEPKKPEVAEVTPIQITETQKTLSQEPAVNEEIEKEEKSAEDLLREFEKMLG